MLNQQMLGTRPAGTKATTDDFHETPRCAVEALHSVEKFTGTIWEPACGLGAISEVLKEFGYEVVSSDLVYRGYGTGSLNFLLSGALLPNIVTNPPFKLAEAFARKALSLTSGKVAFLLRLAWLEGAQRRSLFESTPLARVWVFSQRLPMMHRHGLDGKKASSAIAHAWFVWDHTHKGPPTLGWL